ncbi:MAG: sporulation transcriptional regulator SpoIIID [Eubacteriaceae bacterium]|jgi:putative DeoR family transcriptional regulator (stage III sporulation protein D)|nr:sporulation transcriptional regulator SpoIIID [Eubacteriaceae bacterium]
MIDLLRERVISEALYIAETNQTVRETAKKLGVSKSTVHKDMTERLPEIDHALYATVRSALDKNKAERHIRGGMATKLKYQQKKPGGEAEEGEEPA